jgi:hypothetical protein
VGIQAGRRRTLRDIPRGSAADRSAETVNEHDERTLRPADGPGRDGRPLPGLHVDRVLDLLQGIDAIVWEMDAVTCRYTFVSERAEEILGYPVRDWSGSASRGCGSASASSAAS